MRKLFITSLRVQPHWRRKEIYSGRRKITIDSHTRSLKKSHKGLKENTKDNGMSQGDFDKEFLEIKEGLTNLMRLLPKE